MVARLGNAGVNGPSSTRRTVSSVGHGKAVFSPAKRIASHVSEASDVVALPGGRMLVVGDTSDKVRMVSPDGTVTKLKLPGLPENAPSQFEGVAYDPVRHHLILSREEKRELWRYEWNPSKNKDPVLEKVFDVKHVGGPTNKGLEGLAYLPGDLSPTGVPQLLGAKEGRPRDLVMFEAKGSRRPQSVEISDEIRAACSDFSGLAVDPKTGRVFLSSDESGSVAELELTQGRDGLKAKLVQSFVVRDHDGKPLKRIEGLTFNEKGDLFVLTENDGDLLRLARH